MNAHGINYMVFRVVAVVYTLTDVNFDAANQTTRPSNTRNFNF